MPETNDPITRLDDIFIRHPAFDDALDEVRETLELHGKVREANNLYITGPSGIGKSALVEKLEASYPRVKNARTIRLRNGTVATCDHVPLLSLEMPSQPRVIALAKRMLKLLGDPSWGTGDRESLTERLLEYIPACGVKGVCIDEAQRAVDRDGVVVSEDLAEWLKELHNLLGTVSFLLVGVGRVTHLFDHDDQIDRRWNNEIPMPPYEWGSDEDGEPESRLLFLAMLKAYKDACPVPFSKELDLEDDDIALRFFYTSRGVVGLLKKLVLPALSIAERENGLITPDVLMRAYDRAFRQEKKHEKLINPWGAQWDGRRPPALRDHTVLLREKKRKRRPRSKDRRTELTSSLTKR